MKVKLITLALGLAASTAVFAASSDNAQLNNLQQQLQRLQGQVAALQPGNGGSTSTAGLGAYIGTDSALTWDMMSNYSGQGREMKILQARKAGHLGNHAVYFGGYAKVDALWQVANRKDNATSPRRFSNQYFSNGSFDGKNATAIQLTDLNLLATADLNQWTTLFMQLGGQGVGATGSSNDIGFQQAYLLFGDLNQMPVYGFVGDKDVDFGNFASVNLYSQPLNRTAFAAYGDQAGIGYTDYGFNVVATIINGGTNGHNLYTRHSGSLDNFAVSGDYGNQYKGADWKVGAGYLNGVNAEFMRAGGKNNGAWDINGQLSMMNFDVLGEYTATTGKTRDNNSLAAWNVGLAYNFMLMGRHSKVSFGYSQAKGINADDQSVVQYVVGARNELLPNVWGGIEWSYNNGIIVPSMGSTRYTSTSFTTASKIHNNTVVLDLTAAF